MSALPDHAGTTKRPLPDGWKWVRLGEVCEFSYGEGLPSHARQEGSIPVYGSNGIVGYHDKAITNGSAIVIGRKGSIGEVHFCAEPCWPIDTTYYVEKTKLPCDLSWLSFSLKALRLVDLNKAAAIPGLNREDAYALEIPIPPLAEQRRIAAVLREQMAAVERARRATEEQLEAANALPAAFLRQVFPRQGEPLPDGWKWVRLGEVVTAYNGHWGSDTEIAQSKRVLVLGVGNISNDGFIRLEGAQERYLSDNELEAIAETDDLLVVKSSGSATNIRSGKTGLCPPELSGRIACSNFMIKLVVRRDLAVPFLVWQFLNSDHAKKFVRLIAGSTTYPNIKWNNFKEMPIPLPPLAEQRRIAAVLREQMAAVERARNVIEEQLEAINKLPAAILRKAFNGEL